MLTQDERKEKLVSVFPDLTVNELTDRIELIASPNIYHEVAAFLKKDDGFRFDYLMDQTAVDFNDHMTVVLHLVSTVHPDIWVLKTELTERDLPEVASVSDLWATAEFQEREIFDLFGIHFTHHPDLRRLFMEDDYGYPLRKDFRDEINMIER